MNIPRHEHPKPQAERANWLNLNGEWDFEFDFGNSKFQSGIKTMQIWHNMQWSVVSMLPLRCQQR